MTDEREGRLLSAASLFLFLYCLVLTLAPAVRAHTWYAEFRYSHWFGLLIWGGGVFITRRLLKRNLPDRDPYILPLAALLSGLGLLTVWRLEPGLGLRQAMWLIVSLAAFNAITYAPPDLGFLRRYKYLLLATGMFLTALTLLFGTNPAGAGPRLWLGCCGFYFQPSEPLKLLLVSYLSAYLADRLPPRLRFFPMIVPTILVMAIALLLLIVQRDLGTASIFILLYTGVLFLATNRRRVLVVTGVGLALAGLTGFFFIDIIHARLEAWLNPWNDPSGRSYQIIQSLIAVANGGILGRGPGIGNPSLVPVAHSDFVFAAIGEELGMLGAVAVLALFALLLSRGFLAGIRARDRFQRLLAAGLGGYFGLQSIVIIGGNLRLLPLTGVTLPFVSYGGSSLLTSFVAAGLILVVGGTEHEPAHLPSARPFRLLAVLLGLALLAAATADTWWAVWRAPDLLLRTDNPRRSIADRYVPRGALLDRNNQPIDHTSGTSGSYERVYSYPALAPVMGYTHRIFGQAGLEASLDGYLRGTQGNPGSLIFWDSLVYGMPPPGLDVRTSVDLDLQRSADQLLEGSKGAAVLLNAQTGEVLVMSSQPSYDPNKLDELSSQLANNKDAPLLNRAVQGTYPVGSVAAAFGPGLELTTQPSGSDLVTLYRNLGFYTAPDMRMPVARADADGTIKDLRVSPLQMALAAAALSNGGVRPVPRIALAVDTPRQGWVILPALEQTATAMSEAGADAAANQLATTNDTYWEWSYTVPAGQQTDCWFIGGTLPSWKATPLAVAVLVEGNYPLTAQRVGEALLRAATGP